jgi:hypothetical protein
MFWFLIFFFFCEGRASITNIQIVIQVLLTGLKKDISHLYEKIRGNFCTRGSPSLYVHESSSEHVPCTK